MSLKPLYDMLLVTTAVNVPGPVAASRLRELGANMVKVEPPGGDPLAVVSPAWYKALSVGQQVIRLNLKQTGGRAKLDEMLARCDLLLTSSRPAALQRLGLDWGSLHRSHPGLCQVAIVGYPSPEENRPGHDLTYQAGLGLVTPPNLPSTLLADLAGAERAVSAALSLLLGRERGQGVGYSEVPFVEAASLFAEPLRHGLTSSGGILGGGLPGYNLYPTQKGWIAIAALEPHFWESLTQALDLDPNLAEWKDLECIFLTHPAQYWESWGREHDLPVAVVREMGTN